MKKTNNISFAQVTFLDGFWKSHYNTNRKVSIESVRERFEETGRMDALRFNWSEGKPIPHRFYDSDVAKWIEAVSYLIVKEPDGFAAEEALIDELAESMRIHQLPSGYINSHYIQVNPDQIFTDFDGHELYTAGHMIEAAIAYHKATGKRVLLDVMLRCVDCIECAFVTERTAAFTAPGHEEIELALVKLYDHTGDRKHLDLCMHFLNVRGTDEGHLENKYHERSYCQSHIPVRQQSEPVGHAVRAVYLYTGMIEAALRTGDEELLNASERLFESITKKQMFITGGIGSSPIGECFTVPYDLPNLEAYSESCAAIALMFFAHGLQKKALDSRYADVIERVLYNNLLSSVSMDGRSFFYENPLEIHLASVNRDDCVPEVRRRKLPKRQRLEVFSCSCCPPNINRTLARLGDFFFSEREDALIVQQYGSLKLENERIRMTVETSYPANGKIRLIGEANSYKTLYLRRPAWCHTYDLSGGEIVREEGGYLVIGVGEQFDLTLDLHMEPYFLRTNPRVRHNSGRVALCYGPTVYCLERIDNPYELNALTVDTNAEIEVTERDGMLELITQGFVDADMTELYAPAADARTPVTLCYRPYRTFANRGESDMLVWVRKA
jgi:DUF1680 family protein